jgi:hypothetical protein
MPKLDCIENALSCTGWNRARIRFLARFIVALLTVRSACLSKIARLFPSEAKTDSSYKRMQRFLRAFDLDFDALARLLVGIAKMPPPWTLALDRTNWKLGKAELNVLMLCVVYPGVAFPLLWVVLEKGGKGKAGNSNAQERIALLERFVALFGKESIAFLCRDREFGTATFAKWLLNEGISFRLRLKGNLRVHQRQASPVSIASLFRDGAVEQERSLGWLSVLGMRVFVVGTRLRDGDFLIVASDQAFALSDYARRWAIKTLFGAFKSRGFGLEETHITHPQRLSRLVGILSIAYCWAFTAGCWLQVQHPQRARNHGRGLLSLVRRGLDYLCPVALRLCASVNKGDGKQTIRFLSCT